jgi:uncharacterized protein YukE
MQGFSVTTERIAAAGGSMDQAADGLAREITTMDGLLADIRAGWQSSEAAPRFAAALQGYLADAALLRDALVTHGVAMTAAATSFGEVESALAASVPAVG